MKIGALILMGGKNSRMSGHNKGLLKYKGKIFIDHILEQLDEFDNIYLSINNKLTDDEKMFFENKGLKLIEDEHMEIGPMGGIYSSLKNCEEDFLFVTACDMPFINKEFVSKLCENINMNNELLLCKDKDENLYPLGGIYSKKLIPHMKKLIDEKNYRLRELIDICKSKTLYVEDLNVTQHIFDNINTVKQYEDLIEIKEGDENLWLV